MAKFEKKPFFEKRKEISRKEFTEIFKRVNPLVPGAARKMFTGGERMEIEKKLFGGRYDSSTTKDKYQKLVRRMGAAKYQIPEGPEREILDKKIRFLKKIGGK